MIFFIKIIIETMIPVAELNIKDLIREVERELEKKNVSGDGKEKVEGKSHPV